MKSRRSHSSRQAKANPSCSSPGGDSYSNPHGLILGPTPCCANGGNTPRVQEMIPHSFQPSLFSKTGSVSPWVFDGFLKRFGSLERMEMEGTVRISIWRKSWNCVTLLNSFPFWGGAEGREFQEAWRRPSLVLISRGKGRWRETFDLDVGINVILAFCLCWELIPLFCG